MLKGSGIYIRTLWLWRLKYPFWQWSVNGGLMVSTEGIIRNCLEVNIKLTKWQNWQLNLNTCVSHMPTVLCLLCFPFFRHIFLWKRPYMCITFDLLPLLTASELEIAYVYFKISCLVSSFHRRSQDWIFPVIIFLFFPSNLMDTQPFS